MWISEHLTLAEVINSPIAKRHGISNMPTEQHLSNLILLAQRVFEPVRNHFKKPIIVSSGYRSKALNRKIGGAKNSQHMIGEAIDIDNDNTDVSNREIFFFIKDNLKFDQLIAENPSRGDIAWVHVSYRSKGNRNEVLVFKNGVYSPYKNNVDLS